MLSTIIAVFLSVAVILWNAPFFSIRSVLRAALRRWRWVLLTILLIAMSAAETHTTTPSKQAAGFGNKKHVETCKRG